MGERGGGRLYALTLNLTFYDMSLVSVHNDYVLAYTMHMKPFEIY
jgi:hypothetical protein